MKPHRSSVHDAGKSGQSAKYDMLHPKNPYYRHPLDIFALHREHRETLGPYIQVRDFFKKKAIFDWKSADGMRALTKVLLLRDFGLHVDVAPDFLCPPLPNRLNYLCWLDDLLSSTETLMEDLNPAKQVIDIGTGMLGIYAILGSQLFDMHFIASDISGEALASLQGIISTNTQLTGKIQLCKVAPSAVLQQAIKSQVLRRYTNNSSNSLSTPCDLFALLPQRGPIQNTFGNAGERLYYRAVDATHRALELLRGGRQSEEDNDDDNESRPRKKRPDVIEGHLDSSSATSNPASVFRLPKTSSVTKYKTLVSAVMTNPPFYDLDETVHENEETVCTGNASEMRTMGGECAFIAAMILDSLVLRESVLWYTAMVGKKGSLKILKQLLLDHGLPPQQVFETSFAQGVTYRWALAWTFSAEAASLYQTFTLLNPTKAADATPSSSSTAFSEQQSQDSVQPPIRIAGSSAYTAPANTSYHAKIEIPASQFLGTMLAEEKTTESYNITSSSTSHSTPTVTPHLLSHLAVQRLSLCLSQLGASLSQQTYQGFEEFTYLTPLGQLADVKWCLEAQYTSFVNEAETTQIGSFCDIYETQCSLFFAPPMTNPLVGLTNAGYAQTLSSDQHGEQRKKLLDIRILSGVRQFPSTIAESASGTMDTNDMPDQGTAVLLDLQVAGTHCASGLASKLFHRSKDFIEAEFSRSNRRWRRLLSRAVAGDS